MKYRVLFLLLILSFFTACSKITVNIQQPVDGANVGNSFNLLAEIRSTGNCMGGERCAHTDWVLQIDGVDVCSGSGAGGSGSFGWCSNSEQSSCVFLWENINNADIGSGSHLLKLNASASCHKDNSDSVTINTP